MQIADPQLFLQRWPIIKANGGAKRDRTADLLHAMQALSQLSYSPIHLIHVLD